MQHPRQSGSAAHSIPFAPCSSHRNVIKPHTTYMIQSHYRTYSPVARSISSELTIATRLVERKLPNRAESLFSLCHPHRPRSSAEGLCPPGKGGRGNSSLLVGTGGGGGGTSFSDRQEQEAVGVRVDVVLLLKRERVGVGCEGLRNGGVVMACTIELMGMWSAPPAILCAVRTWSGPSKMNSPPSCCLLPARMPCILAAQRSMSRAALMVPVVYSPFPPPLARDASPRTSCSFLSGSVYTGKGHCRWVRYPLIMEAAPIPMMTTRARARARTGGVS